MKLQNRRTGEIRDTEKWVFSVTDSGVLFGDTVYNSLAELCEEWIDYEEPKGYWYIRDGGNIDYSPKEFSITERHKEIGNKFETEEEAEKAVEKLKTWKRLKDKGFRFKCCDDYHIDYEITGKCAWTDETEKDLDLLFSQEVD